MSYTMGVDIGTYASKGVLVDPEGRVVAQAERPHEMIVPRAGWAEHRADEDWWGDFVHICRRLLAESRIAPADVRAVATSAIGPCMLPVDAAGRPLMNGVLYGVDTRSAREIEELVAWIGEDRILEVGGNPLTTQAVGPKILWLKRNRPEIFARTARILTSTSYLVWKLTGECVIDHYTAAGFGPLYDVEARDWTTTLAGDIVDPATLPRPLWTTEIAGTVSAAAAEQTGLARGTPVTAGAIDAAAEAVSVGVRAPGDMMMMYGSTIFVIEVTEARIRDPRLYYAPWLSPGTHAAMAGCSTSGALTHWFRDRLAPDLPREEAFALLAAEAATAPPGANGLIALPYFSGERTPIHDPEARGAFFGLTLAHDRGDMYRALIEGIANGAAHVLEAYREAGAAPARVLAVGGGVKNALWLQSTSDIAETPQLVAERTVGASYGDAFLARMALGEAKAEHIARWNPVARRIEPVRHEALARQYELFKTLYPATREISAALARGDGG